MPTNVVINGSNYSVPDTGDQSWGDYASTTLQVMATNTTRDNARTVWVNSSWGNDANTGFSPKKSVLTLAQAITIATALTPSATSPVVITSDDAVINVPVSVALPSYVHLVATKSLLNFSAIGSLIILSDGCIVDIMSATRASAGGMFQTSINPLQWASVRAVNLLHSTSGSFFTVNAAGCFLNIDVRFINAASSSGSVIVQSGTGSIVNANFGYLSGAVGWRSINQADGTTNLFACSNDLGAANIIGGTYKEWIVANDGHA